MAGAVAAVAAVGFWRAVGGDRESADPSDPAQVARGQAVYAQFCAACHGRELEGQPAWRTRLPNGLLPAPPHDASGHTWHHPDEVLFDITKFGIQSHAPAGYRSAMPAFGEVLADADIWAVLSYIQSTWPPEILQKQRVIDRAASDRRR